MLLLQMNAHSCQYGYNKKVHHSNSREMFDVLFILKDIHVEAASSCCHLEVKDASISMTETLSMWNHSVEKVVI